jgi:hypothetical protein
MVSPFEIVIKRWAEMGFFQFLFPFMLSSAIFYGLLRKSKVMGEGAEVVNAVIALVASFMIWAYPIIMGIDITQYLTAFFMQGFVIALFTIIGISIAGMSHPSIQDLFKENKWLPIVFIFIFLLGGLAIVFTSGLWNVFGGPTIAALKPEVIEGVMAILVLIIMLGSVVFIIRASTPSPKEGK